MPARFVLLGLLSLTVASPAVSAQARYTSPRWSPDGLRLIFGGNLENPRRFDLFSINADGSALRKIREDARDGSWSPDGKRIAFAAMVGGNLDLHVMNADGTNVRQLTRTPEMDYLPLWSPDGSKLVFVSIPTGTGQRHDIHVMNADGTGRVALTQTPVAEEMGPTWSPDGKHIAFASNRDGNWEIYSMAANGGEPRRLTNDPANDNVPTFTPDGRAVVYTSDRGGVRQLWSVRTDAGEPTVLSKQAIAPVAWSPDGRWIAYAGQADGSGGVFVVAASGTGAARRVTSIPVIANKLGQLSWLAGCWERRTPQQVTLEMWMPPAGELMLGASRTVMGGVTSEFEQLRLEARGDTLVYTALPSRQRETAFRSMQISDTGFVVENPAHDFPQRISYRRRGADSLIARIEGPGPNGTRGIDYRMRKVGCTP